MPLNSRAFTAAKRAAVAAALAVFLIAAKAPPIWGSLQPGPYAVGVENRTIGASGAGPRVIIWRPIRRATEPLSIAGLTNLICSDVPPDLRLATCLGDVRDQLGSAADSDQKFRDLASAAVYSGNSGPSFARKFPVLLLEGSVGGRANNFMILAEYLASWGYVVASAHDAAGGPQRYDAARARERGTLLQETARLLGSMGNADASRIGTVAWSFGGSVIPIAANGDERFRAEVSFDSAFNYAYGGKILRGTVPLALETPRCRPLLHLLPAETNGVPKDSDYEGSSGITYRAVLPGYSHATFSDQRGVLSAFAAGGETWSNFAPHYRATAELTKDFFDAHVKDAGKAGASSLTSVRIAGKPLEITRKPPCREAG